MTLYKSVAPSVSLCPGYFYVLIFLVLVFTSFPWLCVYICRAVHVFKEVFNAVNTLLSLSTLLPFAVRSSRRTTKGSISQCGNNGPRS